MKKVLTICFLFFLAVKVTFAQGIGYEWTQQLGGSDSEIGRSITTDDEGNSYVAGEFFGTIDLDPGPGIDEVTSSGLRDIFVVKLNADGEYEWGYKLGNTGNDVARSITTTALGDILITGAFYETIDFDPGPATLNITSAGYDDIFIQKIDSDGNLLWVKTTGGSGEDQGYGIKEGADGYIYVCGRFDGTTDLDPGASVASFISNGNFDAFVLKLDASGNYIWAKTFGGVLGESALAIDVNSGGDIGISGGFYSTVDFDSGPEVYELTSNGSRDIFVLSLNMDGEFQWVNSIGDINNDEGVGVAIDEIGNIIATGDFQGTVDFDPSSVLAEFTASGILDIFLVKYNADGELVWANTFGGSSIDRGNKLVLDEERNIYLTGSFALLVDFDPGPEVAEFVSVGGYDVFVLKLDEGGNYLWAKTFGGDFYDEGTNICLGPGGSVFTTGSFDDDADFDPGSGMDIFSAIDNKDCFVHKMACSSVFYGTDVVTACNPYTWIDGNTYLTDNNTATFTLTEVGGCDSIITLDLTMVEADVSVTYTEPTIIANASGLSYQWLDCNDGYSPIDGETNQAFTPSENGNYAVEITDGDCIDTSECTVISTIGLSNWKVLGVNIYPNPTKGKFKITSTANHDYEVYLTDSRGKNLNTYSLKNEELEIELKGEKGIYFLMFQSVQGAFYHKIVFQ